MSEREKMLAGEPYDGLEPELVAARRAARAVLDRFNAELDEAKRMALLAGLFGSFGEGTFFERPFFCDYGSNIRIGSNSFANTGCVFLDGAPITIGDGVNIASGVQLITADHPRDPALRARDVEMAKPVTIGDTVWIGAGAIVLPGITIGEGATVGAGSVVTRDVPANVVAAGNPCRLIREV